MPDIYQNDRTLVAPQTKSGAAQHGAHRGCLVQLSKPRCRVFLNDSPVAVKEFKAPTFWRNYSREADQQWSTDAQEEMKT